ncbi:MAG: tetratricopeptide repeat protein [Acidobacteria bacterium]|nr:MAG: tetratricopeptide repeat protein [Acidobacteriota bacterium]
MKQKCIGFYILVLFACAGLQAAPPKVILVFPLANLSGNASVGWMSEGLADLIGARLPSPVHYVLQRSERNDAYEQLGLPLETPLTLASEYKVARMLGATVAIVGHFTLVGDHLTTYAQWLNIPELSLSRPVVVAGKLTELDALETRLAWELLRFQSDETEQVTEEEFSNRFPSVRLGAFESYIRGILSTDSRSRIQFLSEADRLNPRDHRAAFALGKDYFDQDAYADSVRWLQLLNSGDQDYAQALFLLGVDEYFLGHYPSAGAALKKLSGMLPLGEVLNNLGAVEFRAGHYAQALEDFQQAFQKDQTDSDYAFNMSLVLWQLKKYSQASSYLHKVLAQDTDDLEAHILLAEVSGELGDTATRQSELAWVSEHEKDPVDDPPGDNHSVQSAADQSPRIKKEYDGKAFHLLSFEIARAVQDDLAKQPAQKILTAGQAHLKQGLGMLAAGRLLEAEHELTRAVLLLPHDGAAHQALGQTYEREGKHTVAAAEFDASLKEKDTFDGHLWLARAYVSLDHLEPALKQVQAAQQLDPANAEAKDLAEQIHAQLSAHRDKP